ncbi:MDR family MFS transporter [Curtobacterium ammoniigenes]|uniref:MDR family MFS transporter n=1 Tax=Curtobacterium ammoniigenes TaxID=395387 RepID=UPI00082B0699|nr:MDR family MFS transporter [Curtobacterium ammoniigenes]
MTQTATAPAPAPTTASSAVMSHRQILLVIYGLMAGMFLGALDQTVVGTAIRTIGDDLHGLNQQAWVTTGYLIASTIMTPIYGKLSDIFGRRPLFLTAIGIFIVGSFASSFSQTMLMLAAFRAIQGIGAGGLMSLPLAIMGDMLAPRERAKYQGYFLAVFGISSVIGPLVGGVFAGASQIFFISGWRWVFLINVPIGIVALFMVLTFLHLPKVGERRAPRIDWWGAALVIVTLVPLLLVAEQGRTWGWTSPGSWACYVTGAVGFVLFVIVERFMGDDAIIPLKLFGSHVFSMATILSVLVGFGMFGAMLTIPLYLQIVKGVTPTQSGFSMLPMVLGLMIASIGSGQIVSRTGHYRIFPVTGTASTAIGFVLLTRITADTPLWFLMLGMFGIGLGLGQLMQTLTLAAQNSVAPRDIGVATSAATFFRQIGGTLGTAVLLSVLFSLMPTNITNALSNKADLTNALDAALNPAVAGAPRNQGVMHQIWDPIVTPLKKGIDGSLSAGEAKAKAAADAAVTQQVTKAVQGQVAAGAVPASAEQSVIDQQVAAAKPKAEANALAAVAKQAHASVQNGALVVDWSNSADRRYYVDKSVPTILSKLRSGTGGGSASDTTDTSFLNGADRALTRPFLVGFSDSAVTVYTVGLGVILLAFVLTWFFRVPPLRKVSGLQEQADAARASAGANPSDSDDGVNAVSRTATNADQVPVEAQAAANAGVALVAPNSDGSDSIPVSPDVSPAPVRADAAAQRDTRAPLPDAPTHGAHSATGSVDAEPAHTSSRGTPRHAAVLEADPVDEGSSRADSAVESDPAVSSSEHAHGRHTGDSPAS